MATHRWRHTAAALLSLAFFPIASEAQDAPARCPNGLHRTPIAERDSLLRSLEGDEIALTGFVRDEATGAPVAGIVISIDGSNRETRTTEDGGYLIRLVHRGETLDPIMIRACEPGRGYLTEVREVLLITPYTGTVMVFDGKSVANPGYAVRLDFLVRRRPAVF
jgi:hypothetical protein